MDNVQKHNVCINVPSPQIFRFYLLLKSVMTYACPTWKSSTDTHLLKLQRLQDKVLHTSGKFPRCTLVYKLHMAFQVPYIHDYITKLCTSYKIMKVQMFMTSEKVRSDIGNMRLKLGGS
jgi:hypothetical protein